MVAKMKNNNNNYITSRPVYTVKTEYLSLS